MMRPSQKTHLIYDFWPSLIYWICVDALIVHVVRSSNELLEPFQDFYDWSQERMLETAHGLAWWSLLSLLSSACCAFQLILNAFSVGCAGFNSVLGPVRPFFLAITIVTQVCMWLSIEKWYLQLPHAIAGTIFTVVLSFLPEILDIRLRLKGTTSASVTAEEVSGNKVVVLKTEGMNCVACVTAVTNLLEKEHNVKCGVDLDAGKIEIRGASDKEVNLDKVCEDLGDIGFPSTLAVDGGGATSANDSTAVSIADISLAQSVVNGLLGSSCCLLQLGVNLLSAYGVVEMGCAGFNTALGPIRSYVRAVVVGWLSFSWFTFFRPLTTTSCCDAKTRSAKRNSLLSSTVVTLFLMFLPEILRVTRLPAVAPPTDNAVKMTYVIDNMGCEACESGVANVIARAGGVVAVESVNFENGQADFYVAEGWNFDEQLLNVSLQDVGYELHKVGHVTKKMKADSDNWMAGDAGNSFR